jgi:hypothetical protein
MSDKSVSILTQHNQVQLVRLAYLKEYRQNIDDSHIRLALAQAIEDTQEAIARVSSRLRQLGQAPGRALEETDEKLLRQSRARRGVVDKLQFVRQGLEFQVAWYETRVEELADAPDTQAIFVALAEQTRVRLASWDDLMTDMKASIKS